MTDQVNGQMAAAQGLRPGGHGHPGPALPGHGTDAGEPQATGAPAQADVLSRASWAASQTQADVWPAGDDEDALAGDAQSEAPAAGETAHQAHLRVQARQQLREFLRAVPRHEEDATLALVRPDGTVRLLTRAQLSTAIDRLRPRMRQIMRLAIEERWSRQRVCDYLRHISIKTFERDQVEALDLLAQL
jgi:hypothetical protein